MRVASPFRLTAFALTFAVSLAASPPIAAQGVKNLTPELQRVREALDKYKDPVVAVHDGYWSTVGCVTYPKAGGSGEIPYKPGGMGVHFVNFSLVGKPVDPAKPQILVYEPVAGGKLQLVAAEWLVPLSPDLKDRPQLFGQPFDGPMEGHHPLMPTALHHYDLHVWLWKENPSGMFAPTNPKVNCPPKAAYTIEESSPRIVPHTHK
jgi:hypothetical protein